MTDAPQVEKWLTRVRASLDDSTFVKITLGGHCGPDQTLRQVVVRRIKLHEGERLAFVLRHESQDVTKHFPIRQGLVRVRQFLIGDFRNAHLFTTRRVVELERREGKRPRLIESKPVHSVAPPTEHDRRKKRLIEPDGSPWLRGLGVTTLAGKVCAGM